MTAFSVPDRNQLRQQMAPIIRAAMVRNESDFPASATSQLLDELLPVVEAHISAKRRDRRVFVRRSIFYPDQWSLYCPCCDWADRYFEHRWAVGAAFQHALDCPALRTHEGDTDGQ